VGLCEPHEILQGQVQGPAHGSGQPPVSIRAGDEGMESSPEERDLGVVVDVKLYRTRQCAFAAQKDKHLLGCIPSSMGTGRGRGFCLSAPLC